ARRLPRHLQRRLDAVGDELKCRSPRHLDRRPRIMRQYERWRMIGRIVAPPALPLIVWPFAPNRAKHVAAEDESAEAFNRAPTEFVVRAAFAICFSDHLTKSARREEPLKDLVAA